MSRIIEIHDPLSLLPPGGAERLCSAAEAVLVGEGVAAAELSLAIVSDPEMHRLNRKYLRHDYPTDVLSFRLDGEPEAAPASVGAAPSAGSNVPRAAPLPPADLDLADLPPRSAPADVPLGVDHSTIPLGAGILEGQVVVSADYAAVEAQRHGWSALEEMTLYVVHGCLHLVGFDDLTPETAVAMRAAERRYLERLGLAADKVSPPPRMDSAPAPAADGDALPPRPVGSTDEAETLPSGGS